jgi:hypothetical protein
LNPRKLGIHLVEISTQRFGRRSLRSLGRSPLASRQACPFRSRARSSQLLEIEHMLRQDWVVVGIGDWNIHAAVRDEPNEPDGVGPDPGNRLAGGWDLFYIYARCPVS